MRRLRLQRVASGQTGRDTLPYNSIYTRSAGVKVVQGLTRFVCGTIALGVVERRRPEVHDRTENELVVVGAGIEACDARCDDVSRHFAAPIDDDTAGQCPATSRSGCSRPRPCRGAHAALALIGHRRDVTGGLGPVGDCGHGGASRAGGLRPSRRSGPTAVTRRCNP